MRVLCSTLSPVRQGSELGPHLVLLDDIARAISDRMRDDHRKFESKAAVKKRLKRDYVVQPKVRLNMFNRFN